MRVKRKVILGCGATILCFAALVIVMIITLPIPQSQSYHDFADQRTLFFGIPNTLNVVTNFPFLFIGLIGLLLCHNRQFVLFRLQGELWGWTCFYMGVLAVAFGSSYYHLKPNDDRLVWDRLPMTIAFTSIMSTFIIERVDERKGVMSLVALLVAGPLSILYWRCFDDLRLYYMVQLVPCVAIPVMAVLLPPLYTHSTYWLWAVGFYLLAKLEQVGDKVIYERTHCVVSGYTLKHLCAAMVPGLLTIMLSKRSIETNRKSLLESLRISMAISQDGTEKSQTIVSKKESRT